MTDEAFVQAIVEMTPTLFRVCYAQLRSSSDREDAVQEALCRAWEKRAQLRNDCYMGTWLIRILINECRNIQRRSRSDEEIDEKIASPLVDTELHDAILELSDKLRLPVVLHYIEGYNVKEVSAILKIPQGTVKTRLATARRELKRVISEEDFAIC